MVQSKPWVKPLKVVDGEEFFGDDPGMAVKFTCRCHQGSTSFNKRATKLSSPELTMVKPKKQSICV
jgi:hypothetical protein